MSGALPHRLARSCRDEVCLLLSAADDAGQRPPAIELQNLSVLYDVPCRIVEHGGASQIARFTVVSCTSDDTVLREHFLRVALPLVLMLGPRPSHRDIATRVDGLVRLFRTASAPARVPAQALWAELFIIAIADNATEMVRAWRAENQERFDFSAGSHRVEVKAVAGGLRQHHFSMEQLRPSAGIEVLVASVYVERAGGGTSLGELVDVLRERVAQDPEVLLHLESTIADTLGETFAQAQRQRFDWERAVKTLGYFDAAHIPSIEPPLPSGVTQVRFLSDLEWLSAIDPADWRPKGGLFAAVLARRAGSATSPHAASGG
jgi:hypothetical protein